MSDKTPDVEVQVKELNASIKAVGDQIKAQAEETQKQIKSSGEMQAETRAKVDELLNKQGELSARLQEAEQKLVNAGKQEEPKGPLSAGRMVADQLPESGLNSSARGSFRVEVPRAAITTVDGSGADLVSPDRRPGVIPGAQRAMTIRDLIAPGTTTSNSVEYVKELLFTNNAAIAPENTAKAYSDLTFELVTAPVRTIAHLFKASRQILDDAAALQSYIDARARYGLTMAEETQLLYGNGTGSNLSGLITQAEAYVAPTGAATGEQRVDRIRLALLQAALAEFPATGVVLHPTDWASIEMLKDANGNYLIGRPQDGTTPRLWNRPVVETQAITQNEFLVGSFSLGAQIFDRMAIEILVSTENADDFEKNMVSIRAEERLAFAVYRPQAFVSGALTDVV